MDRGVYFASILFIYLGIIGVWLSYYAGMPETMVEMGGISVFILILGIFILPIGLLRGGPPSKADLLPLIAVFILGVILLGPPLLAPGPIGEEVATVHDTIRILS